MNLHKTKLAVFWPYFHWMNFVYTMCLKTHTAKIVSGCGCYDHTIIGLKWLMRQEEITVDKKYKYDFNSEMKNDRSGNDKLADTESGLTLRTQALVLLSKIVFAFSYFWNVNCNFMN